MAVYDLYSKRQQRLSGAEPDVYQYDDIPQKLRVQIIHILDNALGSREQAANHLGRVEQAYRVIVGTMRRELGVFLLPPVQREGSPYTELREFFLGATKAEACLDVIELAFRAVDRTTRDIAHINRGGYNERADEAIADLNIRFKENACGYQYVDGEIVRVDSELIHAEAVKPALRLLNTKEYAGPHQEFLSAYEHYREGKNKEALNDCLKAFESTMKAICDKRGWTYKPGDTAKALIDVLYAEGLVPPFWQSQFTSLRGLLESSIPTARNKQSAHGQGATPTAVPDHMAAYVLHMTASTLVFLTMAEQSLP
ncbi:STM4504/CBY_0614 family protein [Rhizobium johnstonii]|uniref:STM4504/CBY_0614 family protein n=1 Tax=Rhizobium johnstonii TaxID=3019933 RepID=UPI003F9BEB02